MKKSSVKTPLPQLRLPQLALLLSAVALIASVILAVVVWRLYRQTNVNTANVHEIATFLGATPVKENAAGTPIVTE